MEHRTLTTDLSPRGVATLTLRRPERGNAFDQTMLAELADVLAAFASDAGVRVLVVRGAGRHFCVGADVGALAAGSEQGEARAPKIRLIDVLDALDALPKPTVALVHGACIGGGLAIAACCDTLLADESAFFSIPEARLGFKASALLPIFVRAIGHREFRRYGLSGERIAAAEALRIGLAHDVCDAASAESKLASLIDALLHSAPGSIADFKSAARHFAPGQPGLSQAELQARFDVSHESPEYAEGIASFREKRKPAWYR